MLAAVDLHFKYFYVFDMKYPRKCSPPVWEFLQTVVYHMPGTESAAITFLKTSINAQSEDTLHLHEEWRVKGYNVFLKLAFHMSRFGGKSKVKMLIKLYNFWFN